MNNRQLNFTTYYMDTSSSTYSNALKSALKAGYSQQYAEKITSTMPKWLSENIGNNDTVTIDEIIQGIKAETQSEKASDRLRAWELLAKSKGMFTHKVELKSDDGDTTLPQELIDTIGASMQTHILKQHERKMNAVSSGGAE